MRFELCVCCGWSFCAFGIHVVFEKPHVLVDVFGCLLVHVATALAILFVTSKGLYPLCILVDILRPFPFHSDTELIALLQLLFPEKYRPEPSDVQPPRGQPCVVASNNLQQGPNVCAPPHVPDGHTHSGDGSHESYLPSSPVVPRVSSPTSDPSSHSAESLSISEYVSRLHSYGIARVIGSFR